MLRLLIDGPEAQRGLYDVHLEGTDELLVSGTREPLHDGAAALLAKGFDPTRMLTLRVRGRDHDAYAAGPISDWARGTPDRSRHQLRRAPWVPLPHEEQA